MQELREAARADRDHPIGRRERGDQQRAEKQRLAEHAALPVVDELRQQRHEQHRELRVQHAGRRAHREQPQRLLVRQRLHFERRAAARPHRLPRKVQQIGRADRAQHAARVGHAHEQRRDAERRGEHVEQVTEHHAGERHQPGRPPLRDRARHHVDHVRPRRDREHAADDEKPVERSGRVHVFRFLHRMSADGVHCPALEANSKTG